MVVLKMKSRIFRRVVHLKDGVARKVIEAREKLILRLMISWLNILPD